MSNVALNQVSAPGLANHGAVNADRDALFLEIFSGMVLNYFNLATVTEGRHTVRTIPHGRSATFPVTGSTTSYYHVPGQELDFSRPEHAQVTIPIRGLCVASTFLDVLEDAQTHFSIKQEYSKQVGESLAKEYDTAVLQNMVLSARSAADLSQTHSENSGTVITAAGAGDISGTYSKLVEAFYAAAQRMDERGVPSQGRQAFLRPLQWYSLFRTGTASPIADMINRDFGNTSGSLANAEMPRIAGIEVVKTFNLPDSNQGAGSNPQQSDLNQDYSDTLAVINTPEAVAAVRLLSLTSESMYDMRRQGTIVLSKMAAGFGPLRKETALEVNDGGNTAVSNASFNSGATINIG